MARIAIVLAVLLAGPAILYLAGVALIARALTTADPYPAFMADYERSNTRTYDGAERAFADFVVKAFPVGSDGSDAIAQITRGGFEATRSTPESSEFLWKRHAGPCSEWHSIVMRTDAARRITGISGRLAPVCL